MRAACKGDFVENNNNDSRAEPRLLGIDGE
jgi:hypothetical protein